MTISRADFTKQLIPGLREIVGLNYKQYVEEHKDIFDIYTSERSFEEELMHSGFGEAFVKSEGTGVQYDDAQELWNARYNHETVALAFAITEEAMEDNLYDTVGKLKSEALGRAMASTKQQKAADVLNNAFTAGYTGGDGQTLCSDSHPLLNGSTLDNKDTADISETALENAIIAIAGFKDDRGILIQAMPKTLIIPVNLQFTAFRILKSDLSTTVATLGTDGVTNKNDTNAVRSMGMFPGGVKVNHRLTNTDDWFIKTDCPNGLKMFQRSPLQLATEGDFSTGNLRLKARERYSFGWTDPRAIYGSDGTAS